MPDLADFVVDNKIELKVRPKASRTEIISYDPLVIAVKAPPEDGKANVELAKFLKRALGSDVKLLTGATSRRKVFKVLG